jgi:hypothetical protein
MRNAVRAKYSGKIYFLRRTTACYHRRRTFFLFPADRSRPLAALLSKIFSTLMNATSLLPSRCCSFGYKTKRPAYFSGGNPIPSFSTSYLNNPAEPTPQSQTCFTGKASAVRRFPLVLACMFGLFMSIIRSFFLFLEHTPWQD